MKRTFLTMVGILLVATAAGCGSDDDNEPSNTPVVETPSGAATSEPTESSDPVTLRLAFFANVTHAQPQVALKQGFFDEELGANVTLETKTFNAGPDVITALFAGEIDASYIGPNPAINGFVRSEGKELRIIAGATSGGARLIVRPGANIETVADFANKRIATPQLGNTQDVALRAWLDANGLNAKEQGGNVNVLPIANSDQLIQFQAGEIDGAWSPEPWATRLELEAGGVEFLNEGELWPEGEYVTTHLIVRTGFLEDHPDVVEDLLRAHVKATQWINENPVEAKAAVNESIDEITSKPLTQETIDSAWENIEVTYDPISSSLFKSAEDAFGLGFLGNDEPDLSGIYSLDLLNKVLKELGLAEVTSS